MNEYFEQDTLKTYIDQCVIEYTSFMGISEMPVFKIVPITISLEEATRKGYGALVTQSYDVNTGDSALNVWADIYKPELHAEYLLFHEFTHILDAHMYSQRNSMKHATNKGYTEYHAAQVDFLKILGADSIHMPMFFSMNQEVETVAKKESALEYVLEAHRLAEALITRPGFPADIKTLSIVLGLVFNYLGRLSICKMYAKDLSTYNTDFDDINTEEQFLGSNIYNDLKALLNGWLSEPQIKILDDAYFKIVVTKAKGLF